LFSPKSNERVQERERVQEKKESWEWDLRLESISSQPSESAHSYTDKKNFLKSDFGLRTKIHGLKNASST